MAKSISPYCCKWIAAEASYRASRASGDDLDTGDRHEEDPSVGTFVRRMGTNNTNCMKGQGPASQVTVPASQEPGL